MTKNLKHLLSFKNPYAVLSSFVLHDVFISPIYDVKALLGFAFSALISSFGLYYIVSSLSFNIYMIISFFVFILVLFDYLKKSFLTSYFNSKLEGRVFDSPSKKIFLFFGSLIFSFLIAFDILGSYSSSLSVSNYYNNSLYMSSSDYSVSKEKSNLNSDILSQNKIELELYNSALASCKEEWRGWKHKYYKDCISKINKPTVSSLLDVSYDASSSFNGYIFYLLFFLFVSVSLVFQFLTIFSVYSSYKDMLLYLDEFQVNLYKSEYFKLKQMLDSYYLHRSNVNLNHFSKFKDDTLKEHENVKFEDKLTLTSFSPKDSQEFIPTEIVPYNKDISSSLSKKDLFNAIFLSGARVGDKLTPKPSLINVNSFKQNKLLTSLYKEAVSYGHIELRGNKGYFLLVDTSSIEPSLYGI